MLPQAAAFDRRPASSGGPRQPRSHVWQLAGRLGSSPCDLSSSSESDQLLQKEASSGGYPVCLVLFEFQSSHFLTVFISVFLGVVWVSLGLLLPKETK